MKGKYILQFINYKPVIYSGFDRFNVALSLNLSKHHFTTVYIFFDSLENTPLLEQDILNNRSIIEFIDEKKGRLSLLIQVFKLFLKYHPVIAHVHFEHLMKVYVALCSFVFGVSLITSSHSALSPYDVVNYRKVKGILKLVLFRSYLRLMTHVSKYCFCVSNQVKQQYVAFNGQNAKIKALYIGVSEPVPGRNKFQIRQELNLPPDKILVCNVSAIEAIKGIDIIIEAVKLLKYDYKIDNFLFCHIGGLRTGKLSDVYSDGLKKAVMKNNISGHFKWMGPRFDIIDILGGFDIYIQPSRSEGLPVSIMEACAAGLPCIASDVGGIKEIVQHNCNGYLINSESPNQLSERLNELIANEAKRREMGNFSKEIFNKDFNIKIQIEKTAMYYLKSLTV